MIANFPAELVEAYGAASAKLAEAGTRIALSPNRAVLVARLRLAELEALGWLEGESVIPDQLALAYGYSPRAWRNWPFAFVRVFDHALPSPGFPDAPSIAAWLTPAEQISEPGAQSAPFPPPDPDRLAAWARQGRERRALPRLIAAADMAASFARLSPLLGGNLAIGAMLAEQYALPAAVQSAGGIVAIGMAGCQTPWMRLVAGMGEDDEDDLYLGNSIAQRRMAWLGAAAEGAKVLIALDRSVRRWQQLLDEACAQRRSSSRLRAVAELAASGPSLTAGRAAARLGTSRQGATRLLEEARRLRLVREVTQGNAFRRYVAAI